MAELKPCPFCGYDRPYIQTNPLWDCTEEARIVCPSCHVATARDEQSCRVSYRGDDITRTLAIGRAISRWNRRAERTCLAKPYEVDGETGFYDCIECECGEVNDVSARYCNGCGGLIEVVYE